MRRKLDVIAADCVGRSEAFQCARLSCVLRVAVFGAQHHCAACCAVLFLPLILVVWVCLGRYPPLSTTRWPCVPLLIERVVPRAEAFDGGRVHLLPHPSWGKRET